MAQFTFTGSTGTISNLNANFTQLYDLRELVSTAGYTAATPKLSVNGTFNWTFAAPTSGLTATFTGIANTSIVKVGDGTRELVIGTDTASGTTFVGSVTNHGVDFLTNGGRKAQLTASGDFLSTSTGIGYGTGAGGTVTQATSKSTGVTLNKATGTITMHAASLAATTSVSFVLTNSLIAATDVPKVVIKSGATLASYLVMVDAVAAGSCTITLRNYTGGALAEAVVLSFANTKGVAA